MEGRALPVIYTLIRSCNRSVPHMELVKFSVSVLLNVAKVRAAPRGRRAEWGCEVGWGGTGCSELSNVSRRPDVSKLWNHFH